MVDFTQQGQVNDLGLDQASVADAINRKHSGMSQRQRNEFMRQAQTDPTQFKSDYSTQLQQAQQPTEFWGAGRKLATNQAPDLSAANMISPLAKLGGEYYYYGDTDSSGAKWGTSGYKTQDLGSGKYNILGSNGSVLGTGYKAVQDAIRELGTSTYKGHISPTQYWKDISSLPDQFYIKDWAGNKTNEINTQLLTDSPVKYQQRQDGARDYWSLPQPWQQQVNGYSFNGQNYDTYNDALNASNSYVNQRITGDSLRDWEILGQLLTQGQFTGNFGENYSYGGNQIADAISGLNTLYGSTPLLLGDKLYGYKTGDLTYDPQTQKWEKQSSSTGGSFFNKKKTTSWDYGASGLGREILNPSWWNQNATNLGNDSFFVGADKAKEIPGWLNRDYYQREKGSKTQKLGFLGSIFSSIDPILDKIDPMHNKVQKWTTGSKDTEGQMPYFQKIAPMILNYFLPGVGSAVSAVDSASLGNTTGAIANAVGSYLGATGGIDTGYGATTNAALNNTISGALSQAGKGNGKDTFLAALFGGLGGAAGSSVGQATKGLGHGLSNFLSGSAQGAVQGLRDPEHMLESALTSGVGRGLGGIFNQVGEVQDKPTQQRNMQSGQNVANLAKLFVKRSK